MDQASPLIDSGVTMPGLTVVDGTPRDCPSSGCGAQDDTAVIRASELGTSKASALGRTKADGPVTATKMMAMFMGGASMLQEVNALIVANNAQVMSLLVKFTRQTAFIAVSYLVARIRRLLEVSKLPVRLLYQFNEVVQLTRPSWNIRDRSSSLRRRRRRIWSAHN